MAGNKISAKTKGKVKGSNLPNEDVEGSVDYTLLRKPIMTSITGLAQARKIFDWATEELKELVSKECDILYECKVCRNMFRSLANFIAHKRVFCKEKFKTNVHGHFGENNCVAKEIAQIKQIEDGFQASKSAPAPTKEQTDSRIPLTKDLTAIIERIGQMRGIQENTDIDQVTLQKIPGTSVAVFQSADKETEMEDCMKSQVLELNSILSQDKAVLNSDGNFTVESSNADSMDSVIHISDDEIDNTDTFECDRCNVKFSTQKTLKFHVRTKHSENRLVYPCPDCFELFSNSWGVYRHLYKVHRKTPPQVRRLRESIQNKAFYIDNPPPSYEKRKNNINKAVLLPKITEEERIDQENQAWIDNMESDGNTPRCGGCGRTFERRAALSAHTHTCSARSAALARPNRDKRIGIQIRKDYQKDTASSIVPPVVKSEPGVVAETKLPPDETSQSSTKSDKDQIEVSPEPMDQDDNNSNDKDSTTTESPEKDEMPLTEKPQPNKPPFTRSILMFNDQAEKTRSNFIMFKQKVNEKQEYDRETLTCKKCEQSFTLVTKLYDHMAAHYKWLRFACKLCNYKHYYYDHISEHVKTVHKLKGDSEFYYSTVKAVDGNEALQLSILNDDDADDDSGSRRPSRASSDSSRVSDDSNSASTETSTARKRKPALPKSIAKKKKDASTIVKDEEDSKDGDEPMDKIMKVLLSNKENDSSSKTNEDDSSDLEVEYKICKKPTSTTQSIMDISPPTSRRPVRKRTKPKNEDFEYDLSNLLKMEAQGYRDSQQATVTTLAKPVKSQTPTTVNKTATTPQTTTINTNSKPIVPKKKQLPDNADFIGALMAMSRNSVLMATAHLKRHNIYNIGRENKANVFVRPSLPKKSEKSPPKKETNSDKDAAKAKPSQNSPINSVQVDLKKLEKAELLKSREKNSLLIKTANKSLDSLIIDKDKTTTGIPNMASIKFRRQSLDLYKSSILNKNITEINKAGVKTKILVIKPVNRNKVGAEPVKNSLKLPTIKLKNPIISAMKDIPLESMVVETTPVDNEIPDSEQVVNNEVEKPVENSPIVNEVEIPEIVDNSHTVNGTYTQIVNNEDFKIIEEVSVPEILELSNSQVLDNEETATKETNSSDIEPVVSTADSSCENKQDAISD